MRPLVRPCAPGDEEGVLATVLGAFSGGGRDGGDEVDIVRRTWAVTAPEDRLELVADAGGVVGHVLAAPGHLHAADGRGDKHGDKATGPGAAVAGVAPLSVAPSHQGRGVGSALMLALVAAATARGWGALVLLGDPAYYRRFGFGPASARGLVYPPAGAGNPAFGALVLRAGAIVPAGAFSYVWE